MQIAIPKKEIVSSRKAVALIGVISFIIFTTLGAYVYIPLAFTPVPITLQTFFVLLSGAMLGKRLGSLSQVLYILLGATGLPLFLSGASGLLYIFGPTGGYILGFALASYAIGKILSLKDSIVDIIVAFIIGELLILFSGAGWLWLGLRFSLREALYLGLFPFIPGDILKLIIAVFLCKKYLKRSKALFY